MFLLDALPICFVFVFFFFNAPATTEIYTLSLPDALPICSPVPWNAPRSGLYIPFSIKFWPTPAINSCAPSRPASWAIRLADATMPSAASPPTAFLNLFNILIGDISSVAPTPAPRSDARPRSPSVACPSRARSLASPAPAPTAKLPRSEERRVGKECRARWWPDP